MSVRCPGGRSRQQASALGWAGARLARDSGPVGDWLLGAGRGPETGTQLEDRAESWSSQQALGSLMLENPEAEVGRNAATHSRGEGHGVRCSPRAGPHQVRAAVAAPARPVETHGSIEQAPKGNPVPREGRVPGRRAV